MPLDSLLEKHGFTKEQIKKDIKSVNEFKDIIEKIFQDTASKLQEAANNSHFSGKVKNEMLVACSVGMLMTLFRTVTVFNKKEEKHNALPYLFSLIEQVWDLSFGG